MSKQISIPGLEYKPTIALKRGDALLKQCANCGTVVYAPSARPLGACPSCGGGKWWNQSLPVGAFKEEKSADD